MPKELAELLERTLQRRQALKLMARAAASRQFEMSVWQSVVNAIWVITGGGFSSVDQNRPDVSDLLTDPWEYILQVPIKYKKNGQVQDAWTTTVNYIPLNYVPVSLPQHFFDDKAVLGISMTDFYVGKNGWAIPAESS